MRIQAINDLRRHTEPLRAKILAALSTVVDNGWFVLGPQVAAFEQEYATYLGTRDCVGLANGTDALEIALRALNVGRGNKVATVANAGMYGTTAILLLGAEPVFIDIDPHSMLMDPEQLRRELGTTPAVAAVIVTHLYGRVECVEELVEIAHSHGVPVIEDCAQAHGARVRGRAAGTFGDIGCFSFYPTKNLGALGDGGAAITSNDELAGSMRQLRQYGWSEKYQASMAGGRNSRLDEVQAAVLRIKLPLLNEWNSRRRFIAARYSTEIRHSRIACPPVMGENYVAHLYVLRTQDRDGLRAHLNRSGVASDIHYPVPDFKQPAIVARFGAVDNPDAEAVCGEVLSLPCFPEMTDDEIGFVISSINEW